MVRTLAKPLGFSETELFHLANYLSPQSPVPNETIKHSVRQLGAYVSGILSQEPVEVQRTVIGILSILKSIAKTVKAEEKSISNKS